MSATPPMPATGAGRLLVGGSTRGSWRGAAEPARRRTPRRRRCVAAFSPSPHGTDPTAPAGPVRPCRVPVVGGKIVGLMRQAAFVINPVRTRHVELLKARCRQAAARHGWGALFMGTEAGETGPELSSHLEVYAGQPGDKLVFAVGGDGTVRACAHALAGSRHCPGHCPRGDGELVRPGPECPSDLAGALSTGFRRPDLDVDLPEADGQTFVAMAGLGSTRPWSKAPRSS